MLQYSSSFSFFLLLYLLTASGHIESIDGNVMFVVTQNIVRFGDLHPHSPHGLALSLVAIPFYLVGRAITHLLHFSVDYPTKAVVSLTNAPITALSCALIASIAQRQSARFTSRLRVCCAHSMTSSATNLGNRHDLARITVISCALRAVHRRVASVPPCASR